MFKILNSKKQKKRKIFIYSGAGLSAESGLKTFRDSNGLWHEHKIEDVCDYRTWFKNYELVHNFYNSRRKELENVKPNAAHIMISKLQKEFGVDNCINVTTNVDNLLERAGVKNVIHLHGKLTELKNIETNEIINIEHEEFKIDLDNKIWKPNVVFFNEYCPEYNNLESNKFIMEDGDIVVTIGMSFVVVSAYKVFSNFIKTHNININLDFETNYGYNFDKCINKKSSDGMMQLKKIIDEL